MNDQYSDVQERERVASRRLDEDSDAPGRERVALRQLDHCYQYS